MVRVGSTAIHGSSYSKANKVFEASSSTLSMAKLSSDLSEALVTPYDYQQLQFSDSCLQSGANDTVQSQSFSKTANKFSCSLCNQTFNKYVNLTRHHRVHTGEKPYVCPCCPYRASRKEHLEKHFNRMHPVAPLPSEPNIV